MKRFDSDYGKKGDEGGDGGGRERRGGIERKDK